MVITKGFFSKTYECPFCEKKFKDFTEAKEHEDRCPQVFDAGVFNLEDHLKETAEKHERKAEKHEKLMEFDEAAEVYKKLGKDEEVIRVRKLKADDKVNHLDYDKAIEIYESIGDKEGAAEARKLKALEREQARDYSAAIEIWETLGEIEEAARVRKLKAEQSAVKVDQTVVHGYYVDDRDTIVKDSVVNKSNIGAGGKSKAEELREAKSLLDEGIIDDDEFKQMKKEILGK